jgi:hypothetical protein
MVIALDVEPEAADELLAVMALHVGPGVIVGEPFLVARDVDGQTTLWTRDGHGSAEVWGVDPGPVLWRLSALRAPHGAELVRWWAGRELSRVIR